MIKNDEALVKTVNILIYNSDEELILKTSALESFYGGQIKPNVPYVYLGFVTQEPAVQGGLNRAPGAPVVKATPSVLTAVQKLLHLAEVEGFRVQFTDYPKVTGAFFVIT